MFTTLLFTVIGIIMVILALNLVAFLLENFVVPIVGFIGFGGLLSIIAWFGAIGVVGYFVGQFIITLI